MLIILLEKKYSFLIGWEQCSSSVTLLQKVHQCKLYIVILDYDWLKDNRKFRLSQCRSLANDVMLNILRCVGFFILFVKPIRSLYWSNLYQQDHRSGCLLKRFTKILYGNFEKSFFFNATENGFKKNLPALPQLVLFCEFFKILKLHSPKRLSAISAFWKTHRANLFQIEQQKSPMILAIL